MDSAETSSRPDLQAVKQRRVTLRVSTEHLTAALSAATADPAGTSWPNILTAALELQTCLNSHIDATEGPGGFHAEMVAAAPRLAHEVAILASEHSKLAALVADIVSRSRQECTVANLDAIRRDGTQLFAAINRHLQHGSDLIYEAFESDLGGET